MHDGLKALLLILTCFLSGCLILIYSIHRQNNTSCSVNSPKSCSHLTDIIHLQNDTISILEQIVQGSSSIAATCKDSVDKLITRQDTSVAACSREETHYIQQSRIDEFCNLRYGLDLVKRWKSTEEIWCQSSDIDSIKSDLKCYPYHQEHKKLDGRGQDMFCVATNFVIDFAKISGDSSSSKPPHGQQYLEFDKDSTLAACSKTAQYKSHMFMPHHSLQMSSFREVSSRPLEYSKIVDTPTYLLARDEDCENAFHSTADFMNIYLVLSILGMPFDKNQVILFDKHPDGPFMDLIKNAFSPSHPIIRKSYYKNEKILFRTLIFHLESPAGLVSRPDPLRCYSMSLFKAYKNHVLKSFGLLDTQPPPIPSVTLSLRKRTSHKNVGRVLENQDAVENILKSGNVMNVQIIDGGSITFTEHLKIVRNTNILVGVHGAGLMMIMFAAEEAILIEIHPSYRQDRHFRHAARMTGKIYMPIRSLKRETCHGTSDNVVVPIEEFRTVLDSAVRIARSFDDGLAECGLVCPYEILALDHNVVRDYPITDKVKARINTNFPCG